MEVLGRFVIRPKGDGKGDLILGALTTAQGEFLKPGVIYQFKEILGTLMVVELGPAAIGDKVVPDKPVTRLMPVSWMSDVGIILNCGNRHLLTKSELISMQLEQLGDP
jgi:hypothetical protein